MAIRTNILAVCFLLLPICAGGAAQPDSLLFVHLDSLLDANRYIEIIQAAEEASASHKENDETFFADLYTYYFVAWFRLGEMEKAIEYAEKGYEIDLKNNNTVVLGGDLSNLAGLCLGTKRLDDAKRYILEAIKIETGQNLTEKLPIRYGMASEIFSALGEHSQAIEYARKALQMDIEAGREANQGKRLSQLAAAYYASGDYDKALQNYLKALDILKKYENVNSLSITYNQIGSLYLEKNNYKRAVECFKDAAICAEEIGNKAQYQKACHNLSNAYEKSNPAEALRYLQISARLQEEMTQQESERQINAFNTRYHLSEKENEIELQKVQITLYKMHRNFLIVTALLLAVIIAIGINYIRLQRRTNSALAQMNTLKDKFFSLLSHDLKNPLMAQSKLLGQIADSLDTTLRPILKEQCEMVQRSSDELMNLLTNLLGVFQFDLGRIVYRPVCFNLAGAVQDEIAKMKLQFSVKNLLINVNIPPEASVTADMQMVKTIIRNLVGNAAKFSYPSGSIEIDAEEDGEFWSISVTDHGTGFDTTAVASGTQGERGYGLGLILCREMVEQCGGKIRWESRIGEGSTFIFSLHKS